MAAKAKKKARKATPVAEDSGRAMPWRWLVAGAAVLGVGTGGLLGLGALERASRGRLAGPVELAIEWPTTRNAKGEVVQLVDPYYQQQLRGEAMVLLGDAPDPLGVAPLERLGEHLQRSGWFDGAPRVERTGRETIRVSGRWRRAAAVVRHMGRDYLVDWSGRLMPATYDAGTTGYRFVRGANREPPRTAEGALDRVSPWADAGVIEGLRLIGVLASEPYFDQVAGVDVSDFFFDSKLSVVTDRGTEVVWGGPVGEFLPGEASVEQKLARLREISATRDWQGRLDAGQSRLEIFDERMVYIDASRR